MANTYTNLLYHVVFSTKNRIPLIGKAMQDDLYAYVGGIVRGEEGVLLEIGGMPDHVHLLIRLRPTAAIAEILHRVKAKSSKWANTQQKRLRKFGWQDGYSAFTVSESRAASVRKYIREQESHHRRLSFQDELRGLLRKHGVEFEERYLLD
jgi:REP element-mobilizing transposase RayT